MLEKLAAGIEADAEASNNAAPERTGALLLELPMSTRRVQSAVIYLIKEWVPSAPAGAAAWLEKALADGKL